MNSERQKELEREDLVSKANEEQGEAQGWTAITTGVGAIGTSFLATGNENTAVVLFCIAGATVIPSVLAEFEARKHEEIARIAYELAKPDVQDRSIDPTVRKGQIPYEH